jgi:hypothetical protein
VSRYRCVDAHKAAGFPVVAACQAAGVSASAFYAWAAKGEQGQRAAEHTQAELVAEIRTIHAESGGTYGSPPVTPSCVGTAGGSTPQAGGAADGRPRHRRPPAASPMWPDKARCSHPARAGPGGAAVRPRSARPGLVRRPDLHPHR